MAIASSSKLVHPAFLAANGKPMRHEAMIGHAVAGKLIGEIDSSDARDDYDNSKDHVLSEISKHHVKVKEQKDGMFDEAKTARKPDSEASGVQSIERKTAAMVDDKVCRHVRAIIERRSRGLASKWGHLAVDLGVNAHP